MRKDEWLRTGLCGMGLSTFRAHEEEKKSQSLLLQIFLVFHSLSLLVFPLYVYYSFCSCPSFQVVHSDL